MACNTKKTLRGSVIYQIFVRNFSREGTFRAVEDRLEAIRALGTDIIWLMPIHPIGTVHRKGSLGSPYAISDYRSINPEFGTLEDLRRLADRIHSLGMKVIIDVVYNHTSPDSLLSREHPEWFYHREDGSFGNRVADWSDIIDLDYSNEELWDYQIDTLKYWAGIVDGFRCDVASLIPLEFWLRAREEVDEVRPGCIWLAESVEPGFILHMRERGIMALSDSEIFRVFDMSYDYDCYGDFKALFYGQGSLREYADAINRQEYIYPDNYVKFCFLENHDVPRARFLIPEERLLRTWTAFLFFRKGCPLIYNGQENGLSHLPGLFDRDPVDWDKEEKIDLAPLIERLSALRKDPLFTDSAFRVTAHKDNLIARHSRGEEKAVGVFPFGPRPDCLPVPLEDGIYENLIDGSRIEVARGLMKTDCQPVIVRCGA